VPLARAQADVATIAARLAQQYPETNVGRGANLVPLQRQLTGDARPALLTLLGAVGFVLLIACANIANLLLARGAGRAREVAIRTALGAARGRLVRQLLTESLLLAVAGGALGLILAVWGLDALLRLVPPQVTELFAIGVSGPVLLFTAALTLAAGVLFGLIPAVRSTRADLAETFKEGGRASTGGAGTTRLRGALVVSEVAFALLLLIGAGLMMKSFLRLQGVEPGFAPERLLTANVILPARAYGGDTAVRAFYDQLLERLERLPGVEAAAATSVLPFGGTNTDVSVLLDGQPAPPPGQAPTVWYRQVTPEYHRAMGIALRRGRAFSAADREGAPRVALVSETAASRFWPGEDPVGKRLSLGGDPGEPWVEVVGVVADVRHTALGVPPAVELYIPFAQYPSSGMTLVLRADAAPERLTTAVRAELAQLDPTIPLSGVLTMAERMGESLAMPRLYMLLFAVFSAVALTLAAIGIYGTMAYSVAQRTHEIGIRMALGAQARDVLRLVVGQGAKLALLGIAAGLLAAVVATRVMRTLLYEVSTTDPLTFVGVPLVLATVALLASWLPARRATGVDPAVAFRVE
jgi:putative ABC transport system permease protein